MSSLKELTLAKHAEAEQQSFIKSIFAGNVDKQKYTDYLGQLVILYGALEAFADEHDIFGGIREIKRLKLIEQDWFELKGNDNAINIANQSTIEYVNYLYSIRNDKKKLLAHIYVRHLGDMFGGQMMAKLLPGSNNMFKFDDIPKLMAGLRNQLDVSMADEANIAFDYNIKMIKDFND
jgi:heme oxygenase